MTQPIKKQKRRVWYTQANKRGELQGKASPRMDFENVKVIEVLPGDPPDLDAFLRLFDEWEASTEGRYTLYQKMKAARHGEGGKYGKGNSETY